MLRSVNVITQNFNSGFAIALQSFSGNVNINRDVTTASFLTLYAPAGNVKIQDAVAKSTLSSVDVTAASLDVKAVNTPTRLEAGTDMTISVTGDVTVQGGSAAGATAEIVWLNGAPFSGGSPPWPISANWNLTVGGNIVVKGGGGAGAFAQIHGYPDVNLLLTGPTSEIQFNQGPTPAEYARIWRDSPSTIRVFFPLRSDGGYLLNGTPGVADAANGFFVGPMGPEAAAALDSSLIVAYGIAGLPEEVVSVLNTILSDINNSTECQREEEQTSGTENPDSPRAKKKNDEKDKNMCK